MVGQRKQIKILLKNPKREADLLHIKIMQYELQSLITKMMRRLYLSKKVGGDQKDLIKRSKVQLKELLQDEVVVDLKRKKKNQKVLEKKKMNKRKKKRRRRIIECKKINSMYENYSLKVFK